ncbi:MAG: ABC transporter substrate-binding protein [Anaerolineales bacterium]|nr:ABC transporter substrate-binding protein [Anaerolineales bacterium]
MYKSKRILMLVLLLLLLGACNKDKDNDGDSKTPADTVTLQLSWVHEYSSSPFYAAEKNGRFADQNLSVQLLEGGFGESGYIEPIDEVISGDAQFGLSSGVALLQARAEGKPVVAVLSMLQRSPFAIISLNDSEILTPQDLIGKTVAVNDGGARQIYDAMLVSQGIDLAEVNTISRLEFGIDPLVNGEVDAIGGWIINEGVLVQEAGHEPNFILLSDYGFDTYDFVVFTSQSLVDDSPDLIQRFVSAVVAGIDDVVANPSQAVTYVRDYAPDLDTEGQRRRLDASIPLMNVPGIPHGFMQPEIWSVTYQILVDQGGLDETFNLESAYTLGFLNTEE